MESLVELKLTKGVTPNWENTIPEIKNKFHLHVLHLN